MGHKNWNLSCDEQAAAEKEYIFFYFLVKIMISAFIFWGYIGDQISFGGVIIAPSLLSVNFMVFAMNQRQSDRTEVKTKKSMTILFIYL